MAAGLPSSTRWQYARLVINPTNLSAAYPFGGVEVGLVKDAQFRPSMDVLTIEAEEYNGAKYVTIPFVDDPTLVCVARGYDAAMINRLPYGTTKGGARGFEQGSGAGLALPTPYNVLVVPNARDNDIFVYLLGVTAVPYGGTDLDLSREFTIPVEFHAGMIATSAQPYQRGFKQDITL